MGYSTLLWGLGPLTAVVLGVNIPVSASGARDAEVAQPSQAVPHCSGGGEGPVSVSLRADTSRSGAVRLIAEAESRLEAPATAAGFLYEVLDPHNRPVRQPELSEVIDVRSGGAPEGSRELPTDLADGYYVVRATVAVSDGSAVSSAWNEITIHVDAGQVRVVSRDEFHAHSSSNDSIN